MQLSPNLIDATKEGKIAIFIGAGISINSGLPSWISIVKKLLENSSIEKSKQYLSALEAEILSPIEILDKLKENYKKEIYKTFQEETKTLIENKIYEKINAVSAKIITTNYDSLIESNLKLDYIDITSNFNLSKLDNSEEFIFKIHGSHQNIEKSIIFTSDYEKLYKEDNLALFQLKKILTNNTCLFIGFSFQDQYVKELFDYLNKIYTDFGIKHYFVGKKELNYNFLENIIISNYTEIDLILELLASAKKPNTTKTNTSVIEATKENKDFIKKYSPNDTAPLTEYWTGREEELRALSLDQKVYFITGIGGQGKSALASKFLDKNKNKDYQYLDWRDFKEEDLNLQSKLFSMIELVSNKKINQEEIIGLETKDLIKIFFTELNQTKGIFVFDNIDKYIDLEKFIPTGEMHDFFEAAISCRHRSKFIFTCRPFIKYAGVGSLQLNLQGLPTSEVSNIINFYYPSIDTLSVEKTSQELSHCTQGHPLWINLILAQSRDNFYRIQELIDDINLKRTQNSDSNYSGIISKTILENLWNGLKDSEKIILRALSVSAISESEEELSKILEKKIRFNKFSKSLKSLKLLNLVVEKKEAGYIELHPLVREFIITNYGQDEQETYISLYVSYLNIFIFKIQEKFGKRMSSDELQKILKKIEITIDSSNFQDAVNDLRKSWNSVIISGYSEEQIRLSCKLLDKLTWNVTQLGKIKGFFEYFELFLIRCTEYGSFEVFDKYIKKYSETYTATDKTKILSKSLLCRYFWHKGDYDNAIKEGKSAIDLIDHLGAEDLHHGKHTYHLALRDSKLAKNVSIASNYFSQGVILEELLDLPNEKIDPVMMGNLARCLEYQEDYNSALILLAKCFKKLLVENSTHHQEHNTGYAAKWISEILQKIENTSNYIYFLILARNYWEKDMPEYSNKINYQIKNLPNTQEKISITSLESWQVEKFCNEYIDKIYKAINKERSKPLVNY